MTQIQLPATRYHIRWMIQRDLADVMAIEGGTQDDPWSVREMKMALRQHNCIGMVVEDGQDIVGFML